MSLLFMRDPYRQKHSLSSYPFFTNLIEKESLGDIFTIERAVILHDMSVFFVKNCLSENSRSEDIRIVYDILKSQFFDII